MARVDDVINVSGHRLSTGAIEEVLMRHKLVTECAVVGASHSLKGQIPIGLVVLSKAGADMQDKNTIVKELIAYVRKDVGPVAGNSNDLTILYGTDVCIDGVDFKKVLFVTQLPKTRSGKILRNIMRAIADGR